MQCLFLFRDSSGRLPTAQDLHKCGFRVSEAALPAAEALDADGPAAQCVAWAASPDGATGLALAAEPKSQYGGESKSTCGCEVLAAPDEAEPAQAGAGA